MRRHDTITRWILAEDDDYGDYGWSSSDIGGNSSLYTTFIQPFVDVVDTATAVAETALSKTQLLTSIATYGIIDMLVPWVKPQYEEMVKHDERRMSAIMQRHQATFARTEQALTEVGGNYDGAPIFFALFPGAVIAKNVTRVAADASLPATKIALDSALDFIDAVTFGAAGNITDKLRSKLKLDESVLREQDEDPEAAKAAALVAKVLRTPKVAAVVSDSKPIKALRADALKALKAMLADATQPVQKLGAVGSLAELERLTGKKFDVKSAMRKHASQNDVKSIEARDVDTVVEDVLPGLLTHAARPFAARLKSLGQSLAKLAREHDVSSDPTMVEVTELFEKALAELDV